MIQIYELPKLVNKRSERDRVVILFSCLLVIYILWYLLLSAPLSTKNKLITEQLLDTRNQVVILKKQINLVKSRANSEPSGELKEALALKEKIAQLNKQLSKTSVELVSSRQMYLLVKDILEHNSRLKLLDLKNLQSEPVNKLPKEINTAKSATTLFYRHGLQIKFLGDYYSTLSYIRTLERLPWSLLWESFNYEVVNYPQAQVTIKIYTFGN